MAKQKKPEQPVITTVPNIDPIIFVTHLYEKMKESRDIAEYIEETVNYGRALGYAEGRAVVYADIIKSALDGEFDTGKCDEVDYE